MNETEFRNEITKIHATAVKVSAEKALELLFDLEAKIAGIPASQEILSQLSERLLENQLEVLCRDEIPVILLAQALLKAMDSVPPDQSRRDETMKIALAKLVAKLQK